MSMELLDTFTLSNQGNTNLNISQSDLNRSLFFRGDVNFLCPLGRVFTNSVIFEPTSLPYLINTQKIIHLFLGPYFDGSADR